MLDRIEHNLTSLSKAERKVADWILLHPRQASSSTLADVALAAGASEPTVIRFCRRIGLSGFRELSRWLTGALSRPASFVHRDVSSADTTADAVAKVLDASIQALVETRSELPTRAIEDAVAPLRCARQIVFAGLGASGHVASDASHKYFRLGIPCSAMTDAPSILQFAAIAQPADVLVVISTRGTWPDIVNATATATETGATVIAVTDPASPLGGRASVLLPCRPVEDTSLYTPMSSRLAQLALLDALHVSLALELGEEASVRLEASKQALARRLGS